MKVSELIEKLQAFDPELQVEGEYHDSDAYVDISIMRIDVDLCNNLLNNTQFVRLVVS